MRTALDGVNKQLDDILATEGLQNIARKAEADLAIPADKIAPYIMAAVLESSVALLSTLDKDIRAFLELPDNIKIKTVMAAVASERIGLSWKERCVEAGQDWPSEMKEETLSEFLANQPLENDNEKTDSRFDACGN